MNLLNTLARKNNQKGFTIVELLIVVIVIAILAAITIVSYRFVTTDARNSALQSDLKNASQQLEAIANKNGGRYPTADPGLVKSETTTLTYLSNGDTYCITARGNTPDSKTFHIAKGEGVSEGACATDAFGASYSAQTARLVANDAEANDFFGFSVDVSGDTALVGAYLDDDKGLDAGAVYVFMRTGGGWTQTQKLYTSDLAAGDSFGYSVALDGNTAVLTSYNDDDKGTNSGSVYVFTRTGNTWTERSKLKASDGAASDYFGKSADISGDTILVGAYANDDKGTNSGSAYIFRGSGNTWVEQTKLLASDGATNDYFGFSVALDGDTAVVGAYLADGVAVDTGAAYVYSRNGSTWNEEAKLTANDPASTDYYGYNVAVHAGTVVVGAYGDDDKGSSSGSAYIYTREGGSWAQRTKLIASLDGAASDYFGRAVAVYRDTIIVGAYGDDDKGSASGSAYVFKRSGANWSQAAKINAAEGAASSYFGAAVAMDQDSAVVGAYYDNTPATNAGTAYIFRR